MPYINESGSVHMIGNSINDNEKGYKGYLAYFTYVNSVTNLNDQ